ncbi:hypothetical protein JCM8097_008381 [Rhodosporidiobolus ruineniae]
MSGSAPPYGAGESTPTPLFPPSIPATEPPLVPPHQSLAFPFSTTPPGTARPSHEASISLEEALRRAYPEQVARARTISAGGRERERRVSGGFNRQTEAIAAHQTTSATPLTSSSSSTSHLSHGPPTAFPAHRRSFTTPSAAPPARAESALMARVASFPPSPAPALTCAALFPLHAHSSAPRLDLVSPTQLKTAQSGDGSSGTYMIGASPYAALRVDDVGLPQVQAAICIVTGAQTGYVLTMAEEAVPRDLVWVNKLPLRRGMTFTLLDGDLIEVGRRKDPNLQWLFKRDQLILRTTPKVRATAYPSSSTSAFRLPKHAPPAAPRPHPAPAPTAHSAGVAPSGYSPSAFDPSPRSETGTIPAPPQAFASTASSSSTALPSHPPPAPRPAPRLAPTQTTPAPPEGDRRRRWTAAEDDTLRAAVLAGQTVYQILAGLRWDDVEVMERWAKRRFAWGCENIVPLLHIPDTTPWTPADANRVLHLLYQERKSWPDIGRAVNRSEKACEALVKWHRGQIAAQQQQQQQPPRVEGPPAFPQQQQQQQQQAPLPPSQPMNKSSSLPSLTAAASAAAPAFFSGQPSRPVHTAAPASSTSRPAHSRTQSAQDPLAARAPPAPTPEKDPALSRSTPASSCRDTFSGQPEFARYSVAPSGGLGTSAGAGSSISPSRSLPPPSSDHFLPLAASGSPPKTAPSSAHPATSTSSSAPHTASTSSSFSYTASTSSAPSSAPPTMTTFRLPFAPSASSAPASVLVLDSTLPPPEPFVPPPAPPLPKPTFTPHSSSSSSVWALEKAKLSNLSPSKFEAALRRTEQDRALVEAQERARGVARMAAARTMEKRVAAREKREAEAKGKEKEKESVGDVERAELQEEALKRDETETEEEETVDAKMEVSPSSRQLSLPPPPPPAADAFLPTPVSTPDVEVKPTLVRAPTPPVAPSPAPLALPKRATTPSNKLAADSPAKRRKLEEQETTVKEEEEVDQLADEEDVKPFAPSRLSAPADSSTASPTPSLPLPPPLPPPVAAPRKAVPLFRGWKGARKAARAFMEDLRREEEMEGLVEGV